MKRLVMRSVRRILRRALVGVAVAASAAHAHPIHTTLTVITPDANGATFSVRAFADDFSAVVARFVGKKPPKDSSALDIDVARYVGAHFTVANSVNMPIVLQPCGVRREKELYWICFRAVLPNSARGAKVRNQMLTELHADQVNIVQVEHKGARKTMLFTKGSAPAELGIRD